MVVVCRHVKMASKGLGTHAGWGLDTRSCSLVASMRLGMPAKETPGWWGLGTRSWMVWGWPDCKGGWACTP